MLRTHSSHVSVNAPEPPIDINKSTVLGMGGAIAIEDAVSLALILHDGVSASEVPERLKLYQEIRHERATTVQYGSRVSGNDVGDIPEGSSSPCDPSPRSWAHRVSGFNRDVASENAHHFDEWENTTNRVQEWEAQRI